MTGSKTGGIRAKETNYTRHGFNFYQTIGSIGGRAKFPGKGFAGNREMAKAAGKLGGLVSRRGKVKSEFKTKEIERAYKHLLKVKQTADRKRELEKKYPSVI